MKIYRVVCVLAFTVILTVAPGIQASDLVDLNTATVEQLEALPGLGPERAKLIVRVREKNGPFRSVEELLSIPRLTRRQFDRLKELVTVKEETGSSASGRSASDSPEASQD